MLMHLGYIKKSLCLLILLVFTSVINGQAIKNCKIRFDKDVHSDIIASGRSVVINYSLPEIDLTGFSTDNGSFYRISAPGHKFSNSAADETCEKSGIDNLEPNFIGGLKSGAGLRRPQSPPQSQDSGF